MSASLSPKKLEDIATFKMLANTSDDAECVSLLESHDWDLESAVQTYLAIQAARSTLPPAHTTPATSNPTLRTESSFTREFYQTPGVPSRQTSYAAASTITSSSNTSALGTAPSSLSGATTPAAPPRLAASVSTPNAATTTATATNNSSTSNNNNNNNTNNANANSQTPTSRGGFLSNIPVLSTLTNLIFGRSYSEVNTSTSSSSTPTSTSSSSSPAVTVQSKFITSLRERYGVHGPNWFLGSYTEAIREAKAKNKLLFIYIHSPSHENTDSFLKSVLYTETIQNFFSEAQCVCWIGDVSKSEPYTLFQKLKATSFPYVALLAPDFKAPNSSSSSAADTVAIIFRHEGLIELDTLISSLLQRIEGHQEVTAIQRKKAQVVRENKSLRELQDEEYQEALRRDQELEEMRKLSLQKEEEEKKERVRQEQEALEQERLKVLEAERKEAERIALLNSLPEEPAATTAGAVTVGLRFPNGKKCSRRFLDSTTLQMIYVYIQSTEFAQSLSSISPQKLSLITLHPRKLYTDLSLTLKQLNMGKQILFVLEEKIEEDGGETMTPA